MNDKVLDEARTIIAGFFKNRRIELKLSQQEVADRTGMARATINRMEQGLFWPGLKQHLQICEALHLFPVVAEMESDTPIAEALRKNWRPNKPAMTVEKAIQMRKSGKVDKLSEN